MEELSARKYLTLFVVAGVRNENTSQEQRILFQSRIYCANIYVGGSEQLFALPSHFIPEFRKYYIRLISSYDVWLTVCVLGPVLKIRLWAKALCCHHSVSSGLLMGWSFVAVRRKQSKYRTDELKLLGRRMKQNIRHVMGIIAETQQRNIVLESHVLRSSGKGEALKV